MNDIEKLYQELTDAALDCLKASQAYRAHMDAEPQETPVPAVIETPAQCSLYTLAVLNQQEAYDLWKSRTFDISRARSTTEDALLVVLGKFKLKRYTWIKVTLEGKEYGVRQKWWPNQGRSAVIETWDEVMRIVAEQEKEANSL